MLWAGVVVVTAPSAESTVWLKGSAVPVWRPSTARESPAQAVATLRGAVGAVHQTDWWCPGRTVATGGFYGFRVM